MTGLPIMLANDDESTETLVRREPPATRGEDRRCGRKRWPALAVVLGLRGAPQRGHLRRAAARKCPRDRGEDPRCEGRQEVVGEEVRGVGARRSPRASPDRRG